MTSKTLIEAEHLFDYDEPGIDEATRSRLAHEFPHLSLQLDEHSERDIANGGWPSIRIYGTFRGQPHDSIDIVIGMYRHGDGYDYEVEMYDKPQMWMRGHVQVVATPYLHGDTIKIPAYRVESTDGLIEQLKRLDKEYFSKAHEYSGPHRKPNIPFG